MNCIKLDLFPEVTHKCDAFVGSALWKYHVSVIEIGQSSLHRIASALTKRKLRVSGYFTPLIQMEYDSPKN